MTKHDGYFEGEGYVVTWAFGHLFSLADVEEYSASKEEKPRWTMENLPCFPEKFKFEIKKDNSNYVYSKLSIHSIYVDCS